MKRIILASGSLWRKKLLSWMEVDFDVMVSDFDEESVDEKDPKKLVKTLAEKKAEITAGKLDEGMVIGADTMIVLDGKVIGKPQDIDDAREILSSLRGREHMVYTGICVLDVESGKKLVELDETKMVFSNFSNKALEDYLVTGDSLGKAGAYQFIKIEDVFVDSYEGSVSGVIGLPMERLFEMFRRFGFWLDVDTKKVLMNKIGYVD